jgi:PAS domain S-box-containing protein
LLSGDERVFRTLFAAYPDALILADARGAIVLANPAAAKLLGYPIDELVGLNVDALVPDTIRPRHAAYRDAYARNPRPWPMGTDMELVAKRRDGSEVMVEIALSPLQNLGLPLVVAAIRDIGTYPRVKQALQGARYSEHLAQLSRSTRAIHRCCSSRCPRSPRTRCRSMRASYSCSSRTASSSALPAASA